MSPTLLSSMFATTDRKRLTRRCRGRCAIKMRNALTLNVERPLFESSYFRFGSGPAGRFQKLNGRNQQ